jgi:hypothetical protein
VTDGVEEDVSDNWYPGQADRVTLDPELQAEILGDASQSAAETANEWRQLAHSLNDALRTTSNLKFRPDELTEVKLALREMRDEVRRLRELTQTQSSTIDSLYQELRNASKWGRKDFLNMALGVGVQVLIGGLLPPEAILPIAAETFHALAHLFTPQH